jgi:hypothetical protein
MHVCHVNLLKACQEWSSQCLSDSHVVNIVACVHSDDCLNILVTDVGESPILSDWLKHLSGDQRIELGALLRNMLTYFSTNQVAQH